MNFDFMGKEVEATVTIVGRVIGMTSNRGKETVNIHMMPEDVTLEVPAESIKRVRDWRKV